MSIINYLIIAPKNNHNTLEGPKKGTNYEKYRIRSKSIRELERWIPYFTDRHLTTIPES